MRQIAVLSGLLAVALGASYMTWTAEDSGEQDAESIVLLQADKADLVRLNWKTDTVNAAISNRSDQQGEYLWVEVTSEIEVPVEPAAEPDEPPEEAATEGDAPADGEVAEAEVEEPTPQTRMETRKGAFKGNKSANGLWDKFTPLRALRELEAGASGDSVFGFDQPYGTLEVVRKSGPTTLVVGGETYGAKDRYVKLDGRIYLVDDKVFRSLDKPESDRSPGSAQPRARDGLHSGEWRRPERGARASQQGRCVSFLLGACWGRGAWDGGHVGRQPEPASCVVLSRGRGDPGHRGALHARGERRQRDLPAAVLQRRRQVVRVQQLQPSSGRGCG